MQTLTVSNLKFPFQPSLIFTVFFPRTVNIVSWNRYVEMLIRSSICLISLPFLEWYSYMDRELTLLQGPSGVRRRSPCSHQSGYWQNLPLSSPRSKALNTAVTSVFPYHLYHYRSISKTQTFSFSYIHSKLIEINSHSLFSRWFSESGKLVGRLFASITEAVEDENTFVVVLIGAFSAVMKRTGHS